jgi:hypothetical protein
VSDTYLRIIPADPTCVPSALARERAIDVVRRAVPLADDVTSVVTDNVRFVDCGENFETVRCSACGADVGEWWSMAMEMGHEQEFQDLRVTTPCCGLHTTLNDLLYSWPAGFARYTLEVLNPNVAQLSPAVQRRVEAALRAPVRVIWAQF